MGLRESYERFYMNKRIMLKNVKKALFISIIILKFREIGFRGEVKKEQLNDYIIPELYELLDKLKSNDSKQSFPSSLRCFDLAFKTWGWNISSPSILFSLLNKISNECKTLTCSSNDELNSK